MSLTQPSAINNQINLEVNHSLSINNQLFTEYDRYNHSLYSASFNRNLNYTTPYRVTESFLYSFCSDLAMEFCYNQTLATCDQCSYAGFVSFGVLVGFAGIVIMIMNLLVLWQIVWKKNKGTYDNIKASLAVADILAGFQPLVISPYNLHWTMNSTPSEFTRNEFELNGSAQAIAGGMLYIFGFSSSLYHLVFLSLQRVFAMRWPLKYRVQKSRTVKIGLGIVWFLAILAAVAPEFFPDGFFFGYSENSFVFLVGLKKITSYMLMIIAWVLPFVVMTCFMIYSTILIRRNVRRSKRLSGNNSDRELHNKREASMLKTVALMQVGFTLTLAPFGIFVLVRNILPFHATSIRSLETGGVVCLHLIMTNSLVNPIIYSIRDKQFRKFIVQCFRRRQRLFNVADSTKINDQAVATRPNQPL